MRGHSSGSKLGLVEALEFDLAERTMLNVVASRNRHLRLGLNLEHPAHYHGERPSTGTEWNRWCEIRLES